MHLELWCGFLFDSIRSILFNLETEDLITKLLRLDKQLDKKGCCSTEVDLKHGCFKSTVKLLAVKNCVHLAFS